jgi:hypothetical protein
MLNVKDTHAQAIDVNLGQLPTCVIDTGSNFTAGIFTPINSFAGQY